MTPLELRIGLGMEDTRLLEYIDKLESEDFNLSDVEYRTLALAYERLDTITRSE